MRMPPVKYDLIKCQGGLDQVTPTLSLPSGVARRGANFECSVTGGYTRIAGYERFDGRPSPSDAVYNILTCTISATISVGDTVTGMSSAATGRVIIVAGSDVVITKQTGLFVDGEGVSVLGVQKAVMNAQAGISADGATAASYDALAADLYRADIGVVTGSGNILGVAIYNGSVYAWRNNAGNTAAVMFKAGVSGWTAVTLYNEISFTLGTTEPADGATLTQGGVTATIKRVVTQSGAWAGTAAGRFIITNPSGGNFAAGAATATGGCTITLSAIQTAITLAKDGRYETVVANFGGGTANYRMYGADGVNRAFEFDGNVLVPLATGMSTDTPKHIAFHKQHLFLSFGASLQFSAIGDPYQWTPLLGAGEIAMNGEITNLNPLPGDQSSGALAVYTRRDTSVLYGTDSTSFSLSVNNSGTGALAYTAQNIDQAYVLDDRGIISLGTSQNFGNFTPASLTANLNPYILTNKSLAVSSSVNRNKSQYRVFFSNGNGLYMTVVNGNLLGTMPVQYDNPVLCCVEGEGADGSAVAYFGSSNGYVYQMDKGVSFDGNSLPAHLSLVFNSIGSPRILKRYRKASVEMTGDSYASISFGYDLGYRSVDISQSSDASYDNDLRSSNWDEMTWDNFVFDGSEVSPTEVEVCGTAENISIRLSSLSAEIAPFTVNNIILHWTPRRGLR